MDREEIRAAVVDALRQSGRSPYRAAVDAGLPDDAIRHLLAGHEPKATRLAQICAAVGLEFYVGPPRAADPFLDLSLLPQASLRALEASARILNRVVAAAGCNPVPDDLWPALAVLRTAHPPKPDERRNPPLPAATRLATAVRSPPDAPSVEEAGATRHDPIWPEGPDLQTERCVAMEVRGSSMEPTLPDGCTVLVDLADADWRPGRIFVVLTGGETVVARAGSTGNGRRMLMSDCAGLAPVPWPEDAALMGKVRCAARTLP